jgi:ketosteroid isomerase-like protein
MLWLWNLDPDRFNVHRTNACNLNCSLGAEGKRTMDESNATIIRKAYEDFAQRNIPAVFAVFDAAITWHVPGHSPLSGDYAGHDQVGGFFRRTMELSGGAFSIDVHNVLTDDDVVVALTTVNALRNGISASFPEVHVWRMKNGKATQFHEYQGDEQREDRFWS